MATFENCFKGKKVVITGAGKGFGRALATKYMELGALVYAVSRTQDDLDSLQAECPNVIPILLDISHVEEARIKLNEVITGSVDILVNNAAVIGTNEYFMDITSDTFDCMIGTNLKGTITISQLCAQKMIDFHMGGNIVNISSVRSVKPADFGCLYSLTKAAPDSLTKTMAMNLGKHNIKVVAMNFGYIWTHAMKNYTQLEKEEEADKLVANSLGPQQFPLGKSFIPMDQAVSSVLFVTSGSVDAMTGNGFLLDGGFSAN